MSPLEITIPKTIKEIWWVGFFSVLVVFFSGLAIMNLVNREVMIASVLWLLIVVWIVRGAREESGGMKECFIDWLAVFFGRRFAVITDGDEHPKRIRFGYDLFWRRIYRKEIKLEQIESISWTAGQATGFAGRDMKDWKILLWYFRDDSEESEYNQHHQSSMRELYVIGPECDKEDVALLDRFLGVFREAGLQLEEHEATKRSGREWSTPGISQKVQN